MIALLPLLMMAAQPVEAEEPQIDCTSDSLPQQHLNYCAAQDFHAADAALNAQWKIIADRLKRQDADYPPDDGRPGYFDSLLKAQRAWLDYRDAQCQSEGFTFRGGSMEPFMVATCRTRLTKQRTEELRELESAE
ncbi:hypothetical protein SZ64_04080 [Erythrobacter sp. SG61-1L]|uniref:lysozyme inhibitor LprI family protein n=1 Tax=Erythrobacter sp. SG61-1L TaxID=1603897 RepID=UPI0006C93412|nr:lysozyme inhibitor LprI family protein [Erythrobacter sp. SG61-1L]KPL67352.1 hypothetical protein SZ64_04080 [Erythrobacter sp. SG61-1L]